MPRRSISPERGRRRDDDRRLSGEQDLSNDHHVSEHHRRRSSRSKTRSRSRSRSPRHSRRRSSSRQRSPKRRRTSRSKSPSRDNPKGRHKRGRSRSRHRSKSRSSVSTDSSDRKHRKHRKHKRKKRSSRSPERKERKKDKKKKQGLSSTAEWGKYGIITEVDMFTKGPEFHTWLVEEKKINPETMSKDQSKKEFARFMEDYNTATLPHEKYYHMEAYQHRMARMRAGEFVPPPQDTYDATADLLAHKSKHKKKTVEMESYLSKEQLLELRKVQHERIEASKMKLLGMDVKVNMGVRMDGTKFDD